MYSENDAKADLEELGFPVHAVSVGGVKEPNPELARVLSEYAGESVVLMNFEETVESAFASSNIC